MQNNQMHSPWSFIAAVFLLLLLSTVTADAHAHLVEAAPAVGSVATHAPSEVVLTFSESIEPAFSSLEVQDETGHRVDKDDKHVDAMNSHILHASLKSLVTGRYHVFWRVVSVDTHVTTGDFIFQVNP